MKKALILLAISASAMLISACVKDDPMSQNNLTKLYFDSWITTNYSSTPKTNLGVYILEDEPGDGVLVGDEYNSPYIYLDYTISDFDGIISSSTSASVAKQLHEYDSTKYYGPKASLRLYNGLTVGLEDVIQDMNVGGRRKVAIPGWLNTTDRYKDKDDYIKNVSGKNIVVDLTVRDVAKDLIQYQIDSIEIYMERNLHKVDSTMWGFYYIQTCPPTDTTAFASNDNVYINYTGQLLNGLVFDTNIKNVAKDHGLYDSSREYTSTKVTLAEEFGDYALDGGDAGNMIDGFAYCLSLMRAGEKGIAIFTSDIAYDSNSTDQIPAYSPLRFDIEMIGKK